MNTHHIVLDAVLTLGMAGSAAAQSPGSSLASPLPPGALLLRAEPTGQPGLGQVYAPAPAPAPVPNRDLPAPSSERKWGELQIWNGKHPPAGGAPTPRKGSSAATMLPADLQGPVGR
jgi:hypothetical protein